MSFTINGNILSDSLLPQGYLGYGYGKIYVFQLHLEFSEIPWWHDLVIWWHSSSQSLSYVCEYVKKSLVALMSWRLYLVSTL